MVCLDNINLLFFMDMDKDPMNSFLTKNGRNDASGRFLAKKKKKFYTFLTTKKTDEFFSKNKVQDSQLKKPDPKKK